MLLVADIGNSRIKWGLVSDERLTSIAALPLPTDLDLAQRTWQKQADLWTIPRGAYWVLATTNPPAATILQRWLETRGDFAYLIKSSADLPIQLDVDFPERVGVDRLLNAIAANYRMGTGRPKYIVDAGSAITLDWVDAQGVFRGGAILPGFRLMSQALHQYTARLPLVSRCGEFPALPARHTEAAIQAGILAAILGAIGMLRQRFLEAEAATRKPAEQKDAPCLHSSKVLPENRETDLVAFLTGGDAELLYPHLGKTFVHWPEMTLEGLRLVALHHARNWLPV